MRKPIIVLGPGRCGTSATAGLLHTAGVFMGANLLKGSQWNKKGYFEDVDLDKAFLEKEFDTVEQIFKERELLDWPWGFKLSRTSNHVGYIVNRYPDATYIRCRRDMRAIRDSIARTEGVTLTKEDYKIRTPFEARDEVIENTLCEIKHLEVWYEDLINDKKNTIDAIINFCELAVSNRKREEMYDFIEEDL